ncbi:MAG: hypothetical protein KGL39_43965, partial [Patescibacteria group bacterium]|nr:hypothetical protein [Patescibacteria group bacterium]
MRKFIIAFLVAFLPVIAFAANAPYTLSADGTTVVGFGASGAPWQSGTQGWLTLPDTDSRVVAWKQHSTDLESCASAWSAGVTITDPNNHDADAVGTWNISPPAGESAESVAQMNSLIAALRNAFPTGSTLPWYDHSKQVHYFTSVANWTAWATAVGKYSALLVYACDAVQAGGAWSAPTNPV